MLKILCENSGKQLRSSKWKAAILRGSRLPKSLLKARKGLNPLEFSNVSSSVYGQSGTIFALKNLIFQSKNHFLAVFAPEKLKDL